MEHVSAKFLKQLSQSACVIACAASFLPSIAQAPIDLRVALVIGNAAYAGAAALANPTNDAKAMGEALRGLGFSVVEVRDGSRLQMTEAIAKVQDTLKGKQGIGMLYYAGHGLQVDWRNFMVPVDAKLSNAASVPAQTVDLSRVIDAFKAAGNRMNIVVLDACRDNPFAGTSTGKGLAQLDAPTGTFLAYATAPGNVAEDGDTQSSNGLYTQFLLQELKKPAAKIEDVFKRVRLNVRQKSEGRQIPWESTSLEDDFYFNTGLKVSAPTVDKASAFDAEKTDWDTIKDSKTVADFYAFLQKYPNGNINALAQSKVEQFQKAKTVVVADQQGLKTGAVFDNYREGDEYTFAIKDGLTGVERGRATIVTQARGADQLEGVSSNPSLTPGALLTRSGFIVQDGGGSYDPPYSLYPNGEMKVGSRSTTRTMRTQRNGQKGWVEFESKVTGRETIDTAFGKLNAIRIEVTRTFQEGGRSKNTFWFDPEWGYSVRLISEFRGRSGAPDIMVREMVGRKRGA
jgi:Caspase domain